MPCGAPCGWGFSKYMYQSRIQQVCCQIVGLRWSSRGQSVTGGQDGVRSIWCLV